MSIYPSLTTPALRCLRARRSRSLVVPLCMRRCRCSAIPVLCPGPSRRGRFSFLPAAATGLSLFQYNQCAVHYCYHPLCREPAHLLLPHLPPNYPHTVRASMIPTERAVSLATCIRPVKRRVHTYCTGGVRVVPSSSSSSFTDPMDLLSIAMHPSVVGAVHSSILSTATRSIRLIS